MGKKNRLRVERAASDEEVQRLLKNPKIRKALDEEIGRYMKAQFRQICEDNVATTLYVLRKVFGYGPIRLKRFAEKYDEVCLELLQKYEMFDSETDLDFCARHEMKKMGIDVSTFVREKDLV